MAVVAWLASTRRNFVSHCMAMLTRGYRRENSWERLNGWCLLEGFAAAWTSLRFAWTIRSHDCGAGYKTSTETTIAAELTASNTTSRMINCRHESSVWGNGRAMQLYAVVQLRKRRPAEIKQQTREADRTKASHRANSTRRAGRWPRPARDCPK